MKKRRKRKKKDAKETKLGGWGFRKVIKNKRELKKKKKQQINLVK